MKKILSALLLSFVAASAQIATSLQLVKKHFVAGEPVVAVVTITNHAGQDLIFQSTNRLPWLTFEVNTVDGKTVPGKVNAFGALKLGAGKSMAREIDLGRLFLLTEPGNFSVSATVTIPGTEEVNNTNRVIFDLNPGHVYWSQKVGLATRPGQSREYKVLKFNDGNMGQIYVQIVDSQTNTAVRTFSLGEALLFRQPYATVDNAQRLHVMYLGTPSMWVHCQVDTDGRLVTRELHQRGPTGEPQLVTSSTGKVGVVNSVPYDTKAAAQEKSKRRKASDRPGA